MPRKLPHPAAPTETKLWHRPKPPAAPPSGAARSRSASPSTPVHAGPAISPSISPAFRAHRARTPSSCWRAPQALLATGSLCCVPRRAPTLRRDIAPRTAARSGGRTGPYPAPTQSRWRGRCCSKRRSCCWTKRPRRAESCIGRGNAGGTLGSAPRSRCRPPLTPRSGIDRRGTEGLGIAWHHGVWCRWRARYIAPGMAPSARGQCCARSRLSTPCGAPPIGLSADGIWRV